MKISVNDQELYSLSDIQKQVIQHEISEDLFDDDMKRRLYWILNHKYDEVFKSLKNEWEPKLAQRMDSIPTDRDKFAQLVFSQPDYKNRKARDLDLESKK